MAYRIHFTTEDLARTRVTQPLPLLELGAAVRTLQTRGHPLHFGAWRHAALACLRPEARMVLDLVPARGWAPTFLTAARPGDPADLLERIRATPRSQIRRDLAHVAEWQPLPPWARGLADDPALLRRLCDSVAHVYDVLLSPHWAHITDEAVADRGLRMRQVLTGGVAHLLGQLHPPSIRWRSPVLEVALPSGYDGDLRLEGSGLLLTPSVFGAGAPAVDIDADPQPVLRYPVGGGPSGGGTPPDGPAAGPAPAASRARSAVASLLGPTRAAVLQTIAEHPGCSTRELAALARILPSSASEHATTLRTAGLVRTVRYRNTALHSPTALGLAVLTSPPGGPAS
ncbi:winged helix-turn-helix domain-containing protein [Streptomyces sp. MAR4 CNX-425]|uniref:winged helix-turn-helix domain-containing protein n=1 Tax=Streptomyces sp. MAR4 CNX-425 TaxID=3406343 RepID=UPI003B50C4EF